MFITFEKAFKYIQDNKTQLGIKDSYKSQEEFEKSGDFYGIVKPEGSKDIQLFGVKLEEIDKDNLETEINNIYNGYTDAELIQKFYIDKQRFFASIKNDKQTSEEKKGKKKSNEENKKGEYGMYQYYYYGSSTPVSPTKTMQEFINTFNIIEYSKDNDAACGVHEEYGSGENKHGGKYGIRGSSTYFTIDEALAKKNETTDTNEGTSTENGGAQARNSTQTENSGGDSEKSAFIYGEIDRNWETKTGFKYPVDQEYLPIDSLNEESYFDKISYGLNSCLEMVKRVKQDSSVTFSFAEVYAAAMAPRDEWEKYKEHVITCETAILKYWNGKPEYFEFNDDELKEKIEDINYRLEYLRNFIVKGEQKKVSEIRLRGSATQENNSSSKTNDILATNRGNTLKNFLRSNFSNSETNIIDAENIIDDSANGGISSRGKKIGRCAKSVIIVGETDEATAAFAQALTLGDRENYDKRLYKRYDDEKRFFEMLEANDSIAYEKLIDKVRFFNPAFHSITPEGFNARLTFLQQCTRQGPTISASDLETSLSTEDASITAANLAFGRAPYCILRLGDFLNTKIVIDSINITYPDTLWDLNPDGIGVQFMMAKVSMQIKIIGGSDLSAPIKRLQNAVSFNYYANTSVYDNRSDVAKYNDNGGINDVEQWFT